jgi:methylthioribose-1-phosphate isomerase
VLTVCNAGRLAASGIGTALAPVYAKAAAGEPIAVFACETRPLLQGARLTAWELADAGVPVTVLPDGAAPSLLAGGGVDAVIVGCDRVAANGDVANKIGTFSLAVAARYARVPFYVAGPCSTLDVATPRGEDIEIEQRSAGELEAASGAAIYNPAFDVTPAELITGLITDAGVLRPPYGPAIAAAAS